MEPFNTLTNLVIMLICPVLSDVHLAVHDELKFLDAPKHDLKTTDFEQMKRGTDNYILTCAECVFIDK